MTSETTILVVDDNSVDRERVRRLLPPQVQMIEAATAAEGIARSRDGVDCVLLDYMLPDRNGLEIIEELVASPLPVIMLTGQGDEEIAVRALKSGATDYIPKDQLTPESLSRALRFALRESALGRERRALVAERDALAANERKLIALAEHTPDLVAVIAPTGTVEYLNPAGRKLLGWPETRAPAGTALSAIYGEAGSRRFLDGVLPAAQDRGSWRGELVLQTERGERIPMDSVVIVERDAQGVPAFAATISRDVRDRKKLEAQLLQAQKMEAVGRLAGGVAHDFNNVLTAISAFSAFALEQLSDVDPVSDDIREIQSAAKRAAELTQQLLSFSRRRTVEPEVLDPNDKLDALQRMLRRLLGEDVELVVRLQATGRLRVDPSALEQVVVNLVVNARDAMPAGGTLTISTEDVQVGTDEGGEVDLLLAAGPYVCLTVRDDGVGMDEVTRDQIFEPFFTTKGSSHGTGLGLSTVYGIVRQAGGDVWVSSEKGKGATFRVYLPRVRAHASVRPPAQSVRTEDGGTECILLVEDDPQIRRVAQRTLERRGYDVRVAADGSAAIELVQRDQGLRPDLLLTDVIMPGATGKQVADHMSERMPELKVLFMSGYTSDAVASQGVVDEGVELLQKPFSPAGLAARVRRVLDAERDYARGTAPRRDRVLVVDDDPVQLEILRTTLAGEFDVVLADSGHAALQVIERSPPDMVLCDYRMPDMDGRQLFASVQAIDAQLAERFVFMTALEGDQLLDFVKAVDRRVLHKPLDGEEVRQALRA